MTNQKTESEKAMARTLKLGGTLLVAFFRDQDTLMKVISQLPYVELDLPHLTERDGTACQAISNIRLKDGTIGFSLITGGNLTPKEIQVAMDLMNKYGEEQLFTFARKDDSSQSKAEGALVKTQSVPLPKPGVGEEIKKPQEKSQISIWRIVVGAFLTFIGVAGICMMLSGKSTDVPVATACFCVPIMLLFGISLLWQGITGKGIPSKLETAQSPSKRISSISKPARSPSQPETEPSWVKSLAIASLVLSISALPASVVGCGLFFPILAVIFGLVSYIQARKSNSPRNIRLMALAGAMLGGLLIILLAIVLVAALIWQYT